MVSRIFPKSIVICLCSLNKEEEALMDLGVGVGLGDISEAASVI